ncbi:hypothetical protein BC830DRAFT_1176011 [Chytriomyces sp. MP71]|nr:hypothetical protein BC830DRAFT_1176011 [Chytriomyces sp. MP71]
MEWPKNWWQSDVMKQLSKLHGAKELRVIVHYGGFATITNMTKLYVNEWEDRQHDMTRLLLDLPSLNHICLSSKKLSEKVIRNVRDFTTVLKVNDSTSRQITLHIAWVDSKVESSAHETELLLSSWSLIHVPPIGMPHTQSHQVLGMIRSPLSLTTANHWKENAVAYNNAPRSPLASNNPKGLGKAASHQT